LEKHRALSGRSRLERRTWNEKNLLIFFQLKLPSCFQAESFVTPNGQNLWWHWPSTEGLGDALLTVWTIVKVDSHEKGMLAPTINAMNVDFVGRHRLIFVAPVLNTTVGECA
jgi:hypothetical protein